jgi:hypothetical protein
MSRGYRDLINDAQCRHVLGISGGKDSAALAIYLKENCPEVHEKIEYFFTDTGAELEEVYDFLARLEAYLGKEIKRLSSGKPFDHWLKMHNGYLPSPQQRWCTRVMKIKPFEEFVGDDPVVTYVGIRADENREGYISQKPTIKAVFPFIEDGLVRDDIFQLLEETVGIPEYYRWRSRSGCYFCFFQRQDEWLGLKRNNHVLFEQEKEYENRIRKKFDWKDGEVDVGGHGYTWNSQGTLMELVERAEIREEKIKGLSHNDSMRWQDVLRDKDDEDPEEQACLICSL